MKLTDQLIQIAFANLKYNLETFFSPASLILLKCFIFCLLDTLWERSIRHNPSLQSIHEIPFYFLVEINLSCIVFFLGEGKRLGILISNQHQVVQLMQMRAFSPKLSIILHLEKQYLRKSKCLMFISILYFSLQLPISDAV